MKKQKVYMLEDVQDGTQAKRVYLDKESAEIALQETYPEYWIETKQAQVIEVFARSYIQKGEES